MIRFVLPAIVLSVGLHAGLLAWAGIPDAVVHGAESTVFSTVIVFDAQSSPVVSASADADEVAEQQPVEAEDQVAETRPDKAPAEAQPAESVEDVKTGQAAQEPESVIETQEEEPQPVAEPVLAEQPEPVADAVQVRTVGARPIVPIPRNKPQLPVKLKQEKLSSKEPGLRKAKQKPGAKPVRKAKRRAVRKTASRRTGSKKAQSRAGSAGRAGGASAGEKASYARRVLSHIQRYKSFPQGAHAGKVRLKVRVSASGRLQSAAVRRSSGYRVLDRAALATARRASPYPKPPGGRGFSFTVSLKYKR